MISFHRFVELINEGAFGYLSTYRVEDPALMHQLSSLDGIEIEEDEDGQGGTITINQTVHPQAAQQLYALASQKKIRAVAGPATQDMTGQAVAGNVKLNYTP